MFYIRLGISIYSLYEIIEYIYKKWRWLKLSDYITMKLVNAGYISSDTKDSYKYGIDVLIVNIIPIIIILSLSYCVNRTSFGILFLLSFIPIRVNIGGYHCKKITTCTLSFTILYVLVLWLGFSNIFYILKVIGLCCLPIIYWSTPITYNAIKYPENNMIKAKNRVKDVCFMMLLLILIDGYTYSYRALYMACILNVILYMIGVIDLKRKEVRINEY